MFSNRSQMTSNCGKNKTVAHEAIAECVTDILTTFWRPLWSVCWADARQHGIYLFCTMKKQTTFLFQNSKADLCPLRQTWKKPFDVICCLYKNEAISLVAMHSKIIVIGPGKSCHRELDLNGFPWNENLQQKQNWTAKSTNLKENAGKIKVVFVIRAVLWAEKFGWYLEFCWSWKNTLERLAVAVNTEGHSIRILNERRVVGVVGDSQISSTKYRRHLIATIQLAVSCSELCFAHPLCLEMDWNIRGVK